MQIDSFRTGIEAATALDTFCRTQAFVRVYPGSEGLVAFGYQRDEGAHRADPMTPFLQNEKFQEDDGRKQKKRPRGFVILDQTPDSDECGNGKTDGADEAKYGKTKSDG